MVDTVGIEILCHLTETAHPPRAVVLQHLVPVVGGESPVLTICREGIRRSTSLSVQVEVLGFYPGLHTVATDADGDITLQDDTMSTGIGMCSPHLGIEVELYEIPESHLLIDLGGCLHHRLALILRQRVVIRPLLEFCRAVEVAIMTVGSVGHQPLLVLLEERLEGGSLHRLCTLLGIDRAQIVHLRLVHPFVVDLRQGVEFFLQLLEFGVCGLVLDLRQLAQIRILRMQGVDADRVVGVGVLPRMGDVRIVDGQHLQHTLLGLGTPVDHQLQVTEVTHTETALAA